MREQNEFNLTFGGDIAEIDVHTLTASLLNVNDALTEINREMKTNKPIQLNVRTYKPGSFDVYLKLVADAAVIGQAAGLFSSDSVSVAETIIAGFSSMLNLKKILKGDKPESLQTIEGNKYEFHTKKGDTFIIEKMYGDIMMGNEFVNQKIDNVFKYVNQNPEIDSLEITDYKKGQLFIADRKDFKVMSKPNPIYEMPTENTRFLPIENARLSVYNIIFDDARQWEFFYEGHKIPVKIKDEAWLKRVMKREFRFGSGDVLICDMQIFQVLNEIAQAYENKRYEVITVKSMEDPPIIQKLPFK